MCMSKRDAQNPIKWLRALWTPQEIIRTMFWLLVLGLCLCPASARCWHMGCCGTRGCSCSPATTHVLLPGITPKPQAQIVLGLGSRWQLLLLLTVEDDQLSLVFFSKQKLQQSAVVPNAVLTGTLLTSVNKTKCVLALNFRAHLFYYYWIHFFQQKEETIMGKNVGIEREEGNISLSYRP